MLKILLDYPGRRMSGRWWPNWDAGFNSRRLNDVDIQPLAMRMPFLAVAVR